MTKKVQLIIGSTRPGRISPAIAHWIAKQAEGRSDIDLEIVDLKAVNLPFFDEPTSPMHAPGVSEAAKTWSAKISSADAFIVLSSEYNAGYSGVLKNAIDYLYGEWQNRPIAIVSYGYGAYGSGAGAAAQLAQVFDRIGSVRTKSSLTIDIGAGLLNEAGGIDEPATGLDSYAPALQAALDEIVAYEKAA